MAWLRIDDGFADHPKLVAAGPLAAWLHVCALCYAARHLTDGFVPQKQLRRLADVDDPRALARKLIEVGLWQAARGGYTLHDYLSYNPSREEVLERRAVRAESGRAGGIRSGETRRTAREREAKGEAKGEALASPLLEPRPVPSPPIPIPDRERDERQSTGDSLWDDVCHDLIATMGEGAFSTWIQVLRPDRQDGDLVLAAPDAFHRDWIKRRFHHTILEALARTGHESVIPRYITPEEKSASSPA